MDERLQLGARRLDGEPMVELCRQFGISRKTGCKIFDRYKESGLEALTDRSRRPWRHANQLPPQVETAILTLKREKPHWGARKIRERLLRHFSCEVRVPARSTIHAVLDRHGFVERRGRPRHRAQGTPLSPGQKPNDLWCTDYKGEFRLGNKKDCYPLTVTDHASRYLLLCEAWESTCESLIQVTCCGRICLQRKKINLSTVFAGQAVGLKEVEEGIWPVSFMEYDLGDVDLEERTLQPLDNPFGPTM